MMIILTRISTRICQLMVLLQNIHYCQDFDPDYIAVKFNKTFASFTGLRLVLFHLLTDLVSDEFLVSEHLWSLFLNRLKKNSNSFIFLGIHRIYLHLYVLLQLSRLGYDRLKESHYYFADNFVITCKNCYYFIQAIVSYFILLKSWNLFVTFVFKSLIY